MDIALQIIVGLVAGVAAAASHLALTWRAAQRAIRSGRSAWLLLGMPARVTLAAAMLVGLGLWGLPALAAGAVSFLVAERIGTAMIQRADDRREAGAEPEEADR